MKTIQAASRWIAPLLLTAACGSPQGPVPTDPTHAQPPATSPGDGEVIGADGVPPGEKLDQGIKVDAVEGLKPADEPPTSQ
jgi:hypothetical protein